MHYASDIATPQKTISKLLKFFYKFRVQVYVILGMDPCKNDVNLKFQVQVNVIFCIDPCIKLCELEVSIITCILVK